MVLKIRISSGTPTPKELYNEKKAFKKFIKSRADPMRKIISRLYSGLQEIKIATIIYTKPGSKQLPFRRFLILSFSLLFGWKYLIRYFIRLSIATVQVLPAVGGCVSLGSQSLTIWFRPGQK